MIIKKQEIMLYSFRIWKFIFVQK